MARDLVSVIKLLIKGDATGAKKALKETQKDTKETGKSFGALGSAASTGFGAASAAAGAFAASAISGALTYEEELARLNKALDDAGLNHAHYAGAIKDTVKANEQFGTTEDTTTTLLAQGVTATQSFTKAQDLLKTAQDVSAGTGKDLGDVYSALVKVTQGNSKAAKQLGIDIAVPKGGAMATKTALEKLQTAQQNLTDIQGEVANGQLKGWAALRAVKKATDNVSAAQSSLKDVTKSTTDVMSVIQARYSGQAVDESNTRIGQLHKEEAVWHDLKNQVGEFFVTLAANEANAVQQAKKDFPTLHQLLHPQDAADFSFGVDPKAGKPGHTILGAPSTSGLPAGPSTISQPGSKLPKHNSEALTPTPQQLYAAWQAQQDQVKWLKAIAANTDPKKKGDQPRAVNAHATRYAKRNGRAVSRKVFNGTPPSA